MIGAQVLVGDLDEPFLEAALRSVLWCDYFVVAPTAGPTAPGLEDNLRTFTQVVPSEKQRWAPYPVDDLDFAAARNSALAQVPDGDFVLILDADEVHYPEWESISQYYLVNGADSITAAFYHFVVYRDAVQAVFPREIIFRKTPTTQFIGKVHEQLHTPRHNPVTADYRYCHFGYLRGQSNVFERWRRYSVIEGQPNHYDGQNPDRIIEDRVTVASRFALDYPPAVQELIEAYPTCPVSLEGESEIASPKVGLVVLWTDDDRPAMDWMLESLVETAGEYEMYTVHVSPGDSLARSLNRGFHEALTAGCEYVGWIHPDMRFDDPGWLGGLLHELRCWPKVAKVCSANTRDRIPEDMVAGQEQCYLVRADALREVGLFDEGYVGIGGYEDWDMNARLLGAGHRVVITPRSLVFHEGMATRSRRDTTAEQVANAEYFESKWGDRGCPV